MKRKCILLFSQLCFLNTIAIAETTSIQKPWISAEYLYSWSEDSPVGVPLVTENNNPSSFANINETGTQIIFGAGSNANHFNLNGVSGGNLSVGTWLDNNNQVGVEGSLFGLYASKSSFTASSMNGQFAVTNIPFFDVLNSTENVLVNKHPNKATVSDSFQPWGLELNGLYNMTERAHFPLILMTGFRYINLAEDLTLNDTISQSPGIVNVQDNFSTRNNFFGFQLGAKSHIDYEKLTLDIIAKLALGDNLEKLMISGQVTSNGAPIQNFGLFSEPSNLGSFYHNQFAAIPEVRARLSYHCTKHFKSFIGYNFFYVFNIVRAGNQIDRNINTSQNPAMGGSGTLSGPALPAAHFSHSNMWMQGLNAGLEYSF